MDTAEQLNIIAIEP